MNCFRLGIVSVCVSAFALATCGSANGLELFVTGERDSTTPAFGKFIIDLGTGNVANSEISTPGG